MDSLRDPMGLWCSRTQGKSNMISPYLERPIRTLETVLADVERKHRAAVRPLEGYT
jgi:hypothetical protein